MHILPIKTYQSAQVYMMEKLLWCITLLAWHWQLNLVSLEKWEIRAYKTKKYRLKWSLAIDSWSPEPSACRASP